MKERVRRAIQHLPTDRVPKGEISIDDAVVKRELECSSVGFEERLQFANKLELDIVCVSPEVPASGKKLPEPCDVSWPGLEQWVLESGRFIFAILDGPFEWGIRIMGFNDFITLPMRSAPSVVDFIEKVEKLNIELARHLIDNGVDGLIIADDIAYQRGLLSSPETIKKYFLPSLASQVEKISGKGLPVFFHSDGNFGEIVSDIVRIGFKGVHCIDPNSGMDISALKLQWGKRLCLWGNLSPDDLQESHDPAYLQKLKSTILSLASESGYILGTTCGIFEGLDLEALSALYSSLQE